MNYSDLIAAAAEKSGKTKADTKAVVDAAVETIAEALSNGDSVAVQGLGNFTVKHRPAKEGRNPSTGATIQIAAKKVAAFKPGKPLADKVNS